MSVGATIGLGIALAVSGLIPGAEAQSKGGGNAAAGAVVFEQCSVCHEAVSDMRKLGPSLKGLFKRKTILNGRVQVSEQAVRQRIDSGGEGMPPYEEMLDRKEKDDLIAYLKSI